MAVSPANSLSPFFRDLAKKQVGEKHDHVGAHLISFKRWLASSPHLKLPQNDVFLLSFLRYAHYEHALAQRRIDNFCTLRCSDKLISQWYDYPSVEDPLLDTYLNAGIFIPLGFLESGLYVILVRMASWSPTEIGQVTMRTLNNMNFERLLFDQRCQIGGFALIIDMAHTSLENARQWGDIKYAKSAFKLMQEASPGRVKHLVFYKESKIFDFAFKLSELWMSDKMRSRVIRVKDDIQKAFKKIPGLKEVLPEEYEGKNGTLASCIARCSREVKEFYSKGYPLKDIQVDEDKRPASARNYIKEYKEFDASMMGTSGTFIKIDPGD
ncbi:hypothetical protein EG68_05239 [Paragonimus skrjabini miyazakii]|uniref:CRAL-TRIO domain-containing protein n=1 Tax=Paragonimus skrjabini miyazakii TaxID=59628 RepID=A0A8S9Z3J7_9TREM|nr:hypothetical protein EG68_05239 [Paragonimus skrjabini miyazakii]